MVLAPVRVGSKGARSEHDCVYQSLRERLLIGSIQPGRPVTLRGMAKTLNAGIMPVRQAVNRLIAERALEMQETKRVCVPAMTHSKFDQIVSARCYLEPELALRALPNITPSALALIQEIDAQMRIATLEGDAEGFMRGNFNFHFAIYRHSDAELLIGLLESVWLQLGPFMRLAYGRSGLADLKNEHANIRKALDTGNGHMLAEFIRKDILTGMRRTGTMALPAQAPAPKVIEPAKRKAKRSLSKPELA